MEHLLCPKCSIRCCHSSFPFFIQLDSKGHHFNHLWQHSQLGPSTLPCTCPKQGSTTSFNDLALRGFLSQAPAPSASHPSPHTSTYPPRKEPLMSLNNIHSLLLSKPSWPIYPSHWLLILQTSGFWFLVFQFRTTPFLSHQALAAIFALKLNPIRALPTLFPPVTFGPFSLFQGELPAPPALWLSPHPCSLACTSPPALPEVTKSLQVAKFSGFCSPSWPPWDNWHCRQLPY